MKSVRLLALGLIVAIIGAALAAFTQTSGGIRVENVGFAGQNGVTMSGLLYVPPGATASTPAPAILAIHGTMNSRETQSPYAIEFARRGYVTLALDMTGHGFSGGVMPANGYGGPDGLLYLRGLDFVDKDNIGLEGHSAGGWAALEAAKAVPDGYRSIALVGSNTGAPVAPEGSLEFPRNMAVIFGTYEEFPLLMWGTPRAKDVVSSPKLMGLFGTDKPVVPGQLYGSVENGSARILYTPEAIHPQMTHSKAAIGDTLSWFQTTLKGGAALATTDQIWPRKEFGTLVFLIGVFASMLGAFSWSLTLAPVRQLQHAPVVTAEGRGPGWWVNFILAAAIPALTYLTFMQWGSAWFPASGIFAQGFTNQIVVWAMLNAAIALIAMLLIKPARWPVQAKLGAAILSAIVTVGVAYVVTAGISAVSLTDPRFWVVALKPMTLARLPYFAAYLPFFLIYFLITARLLLKVVPVRNESGGTRMAMLAICTSIGFIALLAQQYGVMFSYGQLFINPFTALALIIAFQFVPLMIMAAIVLAYTFKRTGSYVPGALINALFVTWYITAGQTIY